eukprot:GHVN01011342.1.p1 GENE.GHVN01011342.1~~GHVN01011342.1.p1  ORF type:complete len:563 (+),score=57.40 GHVN01011342.1:311-1999(+)
MSQRTLHLRFGSSTNFHHVNICGGQQISMSVDKSCELLCERELTESDKAAFVSLIDEEYRVHMSADNLPMAMKIQYVDEVTLQTTEFLSSGYFVGGSDPTAKRHYLNNHLKIVLRSHEPTGSGKERIVGFEVTPMSIQYNPGATGAARCFKKDNFILEESNTVAFTYDVTWESSPILWATRWDTYMNSGTGDAQIHWFSIINSMMIVLFLSGMVGIIMLRTLLRDIARYNEMDNIEEAQEESGWKLVHGEVFRKPTFSKLLAVCAGTGVQILGMTVVTFVFAALGLLSPAERGALLQAMLLLFTFMGFPAGYVSARINKLFEGEDTKRSFKVMTMTALQFPGVCFGIFFILDIMLWSRHSTGAVPFGTMFLLLVLWFGISLPLVFVGSYFGYRKPVISIPVRTNQLPRHIPPSPWLLRPLVSCMLGGVLPFAAVFTELLFILTSIWLQQFFYIFGFLLLVLMILVVTCAEISIAFTYFQLAAEDYRWWWRSYWISAFSAVYVFLYAVLYFLTNLNITSLVSAMLYFGYMFILSYAFFLLTGSVGFLSTFIFVRAIYGSIKVD